MIIMLTGKAGCGKDTAYKIMKKYANKSIKRYDFADPLKDIAYKAGWDGIKDEDVCSHTEKDYKLSYPTKIKLVKDSQ